MSDDNFGPWIEHNSGECPIPDVETTAIEVRFRSGEVSSILAGKADMLVWENLGTFQTFDIIAYRVRLPADDLLRQAIEALRETYAALDLMPYTAMQTGLAGTKEWDRIYGERNAFGACDKARAVLTAYDKREQS